MEADRGVKGVPSTALLVSCNLGNQANNFSFLLSLWGKHKSLGFVLFQSLTPLPPHNHAAVIQTFQSLRGAPNETH